MKIIGYEAFDSFITIYVDKSLITNKGC